MVQAVHVYARVCDRFRRRQESSSCEEGPPISSKAQSGGNKDVASCPPLKYAEHGKVVTRFPPEPSGHLHIGHVKAIFLNDYYARHYDGTLLLRFDDTNPSKEKEEYEHGIIEDLKLLGVKADVISHTSDHFDLIQKYAEDMIKRGIAYMDDTATEQMRQERMDGIDGKCRNYTVEKNMEMWKAMLSGEATDACLRAKIDMQCPNKAMRDPVIYRSNATPHARTKTKYKAYPTYDLACPIVDAIEGVTHAMRDTQYSDREPVYDWFLTNLKLRKVHIRAFSRVIFNYTLLSKRKLKWFVETGRVPGWDDPRFATVKGMLRRGLQVEALRSFMLAQGASRRVNDMEWDKFWNFNKKVIDPVAARYMATSTEGAITLNVTNVPTEFGRTVAKHPKDKNGEKFGLKTVFCGPKVLIESEDANANGGVAVGEAITLMRWGVINITAVHKNGEGAITSLDGEYDPNGDFRAPKRKITWVSGSAHSVKLQLCEYDYLITKKKLAPEDNFEDFINKQSEAITEAIGEPGLSLVGVNECIQLERRGYFRVDRIAHGEETSIKLIQIPDGKTKAMSTLSTKLAHR